MSEPPSRSPRFGRTRRAGSATNRAIGDLAGRVDNESGTVGRQAAKGLAVAVRILRIPTLLVLIAPWPFLAFIVLFGLSSSGWGRWILLIAALVMLAISALFGVRRYRIIQAASDTERLATEFGIAISLSDRLDDTRSNLALLAGADGGWRPFSRLRGAWRASTMPVTWMNSVGDLPHARYFLPPRIGTTVTYTIAALWLVPIAVVVAFFVAVAALAGTI